MLRKLERVIFDGVDIDPRQISIEAGPRLRHAHRNGKATGLDQISSEPTTQSPRQYFAEALGRRLH